MAMTKKEIAEHQRIVEELELLAALRWTHPVQKDVFPPQCDGSVSGWVFNSGSWGRQASVKMSWSECCAHGDGERRKEFFSASQLGIAMYSSEILAWKAARHAVERESADRLRHIDREIARLERSAS